MEGKENTLSPEKPRFLYHGSPNGEIEEFTPRISQGSGEKYGPRVYASENLAVASILTTRPAGEWGAGCLENGQLYVWIPMSREEFMKSDKGGWIYKLNSQTFSLGETEGMDGKEWSSTIPVKPIEKIRVESSLDEMLKNGVRVYFLGDEGYDEISNLE